MVGEKKSKFMFSGNLAKKIIFALIVLAFVWYFRPWFHGIFMFFYRSPIVIEILIILLILFRVVFRKRKKIKLHKFKDGEFSAKDINFNFSFLPFLIILFTVFPIFSSLMPQLHLASELDYNTIDSLPETNENIRLMPYEVAFRYSKDSLQLSQYKLGTENIANVNGNLSWMFPLIPDGFILEFMLKNKGVVFVDATNQMKNTDIVWKDLEVGEGMQVFDNLQWNVYKEKYWVDLDDPFYLEHDGELYTIIPTISYSYHQWLGLFYTVPRFEGILLIDSSGNMEFLNPNEAKKSPILKDNRIFPENLARYYIESYVYNKGLINKWFIHDDQIDIQDISSRNKQPFLMDTSDGLKWFISTEPYGESHGIFKIFLVDAREGSIEKYELPLEETLTGPIKATDFVRRENPIVDWNKFMMVESLPFVTDNILYWKVAVVPNDAAGIAYQAFVNSKTNEVEEFETDKEIQDFIKIGSLQETSLYETNQTTGEKSKEEKIAEIQNKLKEIEGLLEEIKS